MELDNFTPSVEDISPKVEKTDLLIDDLPTTPEGFANKAQEIIQNPETPKEVSLLAQAQELFMNGKMPEYVGSVYEKWKQEWLGRAIEKYKQISV